MTRLPDRRHALALIAAALAWPAPGEAAMLRYRILPEASRVGFAYLLFGRAQRGDMPIAHADIHIDSADLARASIDVQIDARRARTDLPLAAGALRGRRMLDTATHPTLRFVSTGVHMAASGNIADGAQIAGDLTLRGITRAVVFRAELTRAAGTAPDDLRELTIRLTGHVSRAAFAIDGFPRLVGDLVTLDIVTALRADP